MKNINNNFFKYYLNIDGSNIENVELQETNLKINYEELVFLNNEYTRVVNVNVNDFFHMVQKQFLKDGFKSEISYITYHEQEDLSLVLYDKHSNVNKIYESKLEDTRYESIIGGLYEIFHYISSNNLIKENFFEKTSLLDLDNYLNDYIDDSIDFK